MAERKACARVGCHGLVKKPKGKYCSNACVPRSARFLAGYHGAQADQRGFRRGFAEAMRQQKQVA